jgi:hypothetical protein
MADFSLFARGRDGYTPHKNRISFSINLPNRSNSGPACEDGMSEPNKLFADRLTELLRSLPALRDPDNRNLLLRRLPDGPVAAIRRSPAPIADLNNIVEAAEGMGRLPATGRLALGIVAENALRLAEGTEVGSELQALLGELETRPPLDPFEPQLEVVIGPDARLPVTFLESGMAAAKAVAKVVVPTVIGGARQAGRDVSGTGWLIGPGLLITNHHVIEARASGEATPADFAAQASAAAVWFDYDREDAQPCIYDSAELVWSERTLDYALLRLKADARPPGRPVSSRGQLPLLRKLPPLARGHRLNIIQHPRGGPKQIAIRSNFYYSSHSTSTEPARIRYLTDTEPGSSGSPVFDDSWYVLAIHHAAVRVADSVHKGETIRYNNQGVSIAAILASLPEGAQREINAAQGWV